MTLKIALAQLNPIVGALAENALMIQKAAEDAAGQGADIIVFPELMLCGYPPEDLILKPKFVNDCMALLENLAKQLPHGIACIIGSPWYGKNNTVQNVAAVVECGKIAHIIPKSKLPNYGVFDEMRVFTPADEIPAPVKIKGVMCAIPTCEDIWHPEICAAQKAMGAEIFLVPNGSPYWKGKEHERLTIARQRVQETGVPMVYVNRTGGQDELVFDGASFVLNAQGEVVEKLAEFGEGMEYITIPSPIMGEGARRAGEGKNMNRFNDSPSSVSASPMASQSHLLPLWEKEETELLYTACVIGLRDYVNKNGFKSVILGLSGGVDSALCAAIAVDALGAERVHAVMMPYTFTAQESLEDAEQCARNLGISYEVIPIAPMVAAFEHSLAPQFMSTKRDLTEENLQSRIRGTLLMALSNKFGHMVVTTGNKSEMAVGYCTLYGDMNGGFNPIKDLYKTEVYRICEWRNKYQVSNNKYQVSNENIDNSYLIFDNFQIPPRILTKSPSAELRPDQTDQDSLPPYEILDEILEGLVEQELSVDDLVHQGFAVQTVRDVERMLNRAEYKRRQAAPGVKLTRRNFGRDRRYPITNGYRSG